MRLCSIYGNEGGRKRKSDGRGCIMLEAKNSSKKKRKRKRKEEKKGVVRSFPRGSAT